MVRRSDEGVLKPGDPEYRQAQLFKANNDDNGYMKADQNYTAYRTQPVEAHAWQTGDTISAGVNAPDSAVAAPAPANPPLTGESTLP
jgi:hypothetical protein